MVQMVQVQNLWWGRVNVRLNLGSQQFNTGPLNRDVVEVAERVVIALLIGGAFIMYPYTTLAGLAVGSCSVMMGGMQPTQAHNIFKKISGASAEQSLGIALAALIVTRLVLFPIAILVGAQAMKPIV
jgi:hypothetical protein